MRTRTNLIILLWLALPSPARADWVSVLSGPIERVVANAGHAAAVRGGEVWLFRDDGSVVGRVGKRGEETVPANQRASQIEAEEMWDVLGVSELDRDTDWAFDLLDDERTLAQRRGARPGHLPPLVSHAVAPALAATAGGLWIAGDAMVRVNANGDVIRERARWGTGGVFAASAERLLVARPDGLALLSLDGGEDRFVPLPAPAGKVALSASGRRWAWTSTADILSAGAGTPTESFAPGSAVVDLAYCGETLVALLTDAVWAASPGAAPALRNHDLHARRLLCPVGRSMPWLAVGQGLSISFDQGRQWETLDTPPDPALADVAATAHHLWLATSKGLYFSSTGAGPTPFLAPAATPSPRHGRHNVSSWLSWLPKVSVRASAAIAPAERQVEALALAQFPLDPSRIPIVAAAYDDPAVLVAEPMPTRRTERAVDLRDPEKECLGLARRKAVELAMTEPDRAQSYVARAGRAAWLPELRVLVSRRYGRSESLDLNSSSTALSSPLGIDTVNDIRYEARATWDLAKLVFSAEELAAQNQALHMAELRRDIENTVNRLYFERRRLALEVTGAEGGARHLRTSEIEAELDALSAGAFGVCVAGRSAKESKE
jgi:hypothetical protein